MVVFILPKKLSSNRTPTDIQNDIEDSVGFNIKLEHNRNWREEKSQIFNELTNKKRTILPKIRIHSDVKKSNGQRVRLADIQDFESFGNGIHSYIMKLKNGENIAIVSCVFPNGSEATVNSKLAQLKEICLR